MSQLTPPLSAYQLENYCNDVLSVAAFKDYAPNGLQVDGGAPISKVVTGVTASQALINEAIARDAQAIVVHHGYFWKGEPQPLVGMKGKRIRTMMQHGISMLGYHLPLDAHPQMGNNAALADALGLTIEGALFPEQAHPVGNIATMSPMMAHDFYARIATVLDVEPLHILPDNYQREPISRIGLCSGGAQDFIDQAAAMGCDAYISGEISERTTHSAREQGIHYFACGHHATERGGIQRLGEHLADALSLSVEFVDIDNPA